MSVFAQSPGPAAEDEMIVRMRQAALTYNDQLQNFTCTEFVDRSTDKASNGKKWSRLETRELELSYFDRKEHYRLLKVDNKPPDARRIKAGHFVPGGEFGSSLRRIFEPKAGGTFEFDREQTDPGQRVCIFRYRVPLATTTLLAVVGFNSTPMAHHGHVYADCDTGSVVRFQTETEPAWISEDDRKVAVGTLLDVHYGMTNIGGKEFLVPLEVQEIALFDKSLTKVEIKYSQYRKYDADSSITFDVVKPE